MYGKELAEVLFSFGVIDIGTKEDILEIITDADYDMNPVDVLIEKGVSFEIIKESLKVNCDIDFIDLSEIDADENIISLLDYGIADKYSVFPLRIENKILHLAMANPINLKLIDEIKLLTDFEIRPFFAENNDIKNLINYHYAKKEISEISKSRDAFVIKKNDAELLLFDEKINDSPVVKLVESIVKSALSKNASDIHIDPNGREIVVRFRIDGKLEVFEKVSLDFLDELVSRFKILAGLDIGEKRFPQEGHFKNQHSHDKYDFRISVMPTIYGENVVIRIIYATQKLESKEHLGFFEDDIKKLDKVLSNPHGAIIVTGPTGSGKTTTIYSFLSQLETSMKKIITIEDPVEKFIPSIVQINVNKKAGLDFDNALEFILRQDPDVILVGEIRNEKTAKLAISSSITGHLVLSTLHTNNMVTTIKRLIDLGVDTYLVLAGVRAIISQKLVRRLCPHCKTKKVVTPHIADALKLKIDTEIFEEVGCPKCNYSGYTGRFAVYEILILNDNIKELFKGDKSEKEIFENLKAMNFSFIEDSLRKNVLLGNTSANEMLGNLFL